MILHKSNPNYCLECKTDRLTLISSGSLEDVHILELSKRITNEPDLMELGVKVLQLPDFIVKTALYNKKEIQSATHEVISDWSKQQTNTFGAYTALKEALEKSKFTSLAGVLQQWVEGTVQHLDISGQSKFTVLIEF